MSQRKEKYMRTAFEAATEALETSRQTHREAARTSQRVDAVVRDVQQVRDDYMRRQRQRERERTNFMLARHAVLLALAATFLAVVAIILACVQMARTAAVLEQVEAINTWQEEMKNAVLAPATPAPIVGVEAVSETELPAWGYLSEAVPLTLEEQGALFMACQETGVPCTLALGLIQRETNFRNVAGDSGGSIGYMQVRPSCHWDRMERLGVADLWEPAGNFRVGCDYLAECLRRAETTERALMAYNMGYTRAKELWEEGIYETKYARQVIEYATAWQELLDG